MKLIVTAGEVKAIINQFKEIDRHFTNKGVDGIFAKLNISYIDFMKTLAFNKNLVIDINETDVVLAIELYTDLIAGIAPHVIAMSTTFKRFANNMNGLDCTATPPIVSIGDIIITAKTFENSPLEEEEVKPISEPLPPPPEEVIIEEEKPSFLDRVINIATGK